MKYEPLQKIFYTNPTDYEAIYHSRYNSTDTWKCDFHIGKHPAFVTMSNEIWKLTTEILRLDKKLAHLLLPQVTPGVAIKQFVNSCIVDEVKLTNEIEGIHSTRREIQSVITASSVREKKENRLRGLVSKYILLLTSEEPLALETPEQVRKLYDEIVLPEIKESNGDAPDGKLFRKDGVDVLSKGGKVIHKGTMPENAIISDIIKALNVLNDTKNEPLVNIAVFHYLFGYIHPFYDGNGRMSRFISSSFLSRQVCNIVGLGLSYTIKENISIYYNIFKITNHPNNRGDLTAFVIEFLGFLKITIERIILALEEKGKQLQFYSEKIFKNKDVPSKEESVLFVILQSTLFSEEDGITISEITKYVNFHQHKPISSATIRQLVIGLNNMLLIEKIGKANYYSINLAALDNL